MQATTTKLINRIWGDYYSNYSPEDSKEEISCQVKDAEEVEEQEENEEDDAEEIPLNSNKTLSPCLIPRRVKSSSKSKEIRWDGDSVGKTSLGEVLCKQAIVCGDVIAVGDAVFVDAEESDGYPAIYFVEYMFETLDESKMFHGRLMQRGSSTVLGNTANEREVFLTNECMEFELEDVKQKVVVDIRSMPWGHQHRKANAHVDKIDGAKAEERRRKGLQIEYYCKSLYWPEKGAFISLPRDTMGDGSGVCHSCKLRKSQSHEEIFKVNTNKTGFVYKGTEYNIHDFVYVNPHNFTADRVENETFKGGRNVGLKAYVVCQLLEILVPKTTKQADANSTEINVRRFFRPEDISAEKAYYSDIREVRPTMEDLLLLGYHIPPFSISS